MLNYTEFKRQFREAALRRCEDPETRQKISEYDAALGLAEIRRDLHHSRMRQSVRNAAARQLEQAKRGVRWDEGQGLLTDDYQAIDELLVAKAESTDWWYMMDHEGWVIGRQATPVKRTNARNEKAARFKAAGEMVHEVLEENPTQAEMRVKYDKRETEILN